MSTARAAREGIVVMGTPPKARRARNGGTPAGNARYEEYASGSTRGAPSGDDSGDALEVGARRDGGEPGPGHGLGRLALVARSDFHEDESTRPHRRRGARH